MNSKILLLSATLLGGVLSTASATTADAHATVAQGLKFDVPTVAHVVSPTNLSSRYRGTDVTLSFTLDVNGHPHDIRVLSHRDRNLEQNLVPAVAKWQFTPAKENGVPVSTKVILPIKLVES